MRKPVISAFVFMASGLITDTLTTDYFAPRGRANSKPSTKPRRENGPPERLYRQFLLKVSNGLANAGLKINLGLPTKETLCPGDIRLANSGIVYRERFKHDLG